MTRDDILRMAREAGFSEQNGIVRTMPGSSVWAGLNAELERFAALIAAEEREACAKVCDARYMGDNNREDMEAKRCAETIRARS